MGDLGGYIECEENLSHEGDAWIADEAIVFAGARISGDALVYGHAQVFNQHVEVTACARVGGYAKVNSNGTKIAGNEHVFVENPGDPGPNSDRHEGLCPY